ncbi:hypothetical protein RHP47_09610 [Thermosynechococcus sp. QKsg1]|uniref:hypothetical protein n=1 Tax=unclassified Thermosynechococcus TaxID=2622553 RepID=UPI00122E7A18|nr:MULTISPECIES: hypothetical protein [unclassified Thermosynechococcus]QEQ01600.1 hypothetical protein FFX45_09575 [Thermosynechococcus sp. CL-1]WJI25977.1 hypothetical protein M0644_09630 [Thermosynechococcus sp. B1]WJI28506.1 hypothetical protein M0646_09635 [Thermosynechococcus sp. B3]WNC86098.1 hypothetical protein RHP47_09610 [Thermosynechococcus sp. QKsg1]
METRQVVGTWPARLEDRYYWVVQPEIVVAPGRYAVLTSSPQTWSYNATSKNAGMTWIEGYPMPR